MKKLLLATALVPFGTMAYAQCSPDFSGVTLTGSYAAGGGGGGTQTTTTDGSVAGRQSVYYDLAVSGGEIDLSLFRR